MNLKEVLENFKLANKHVGVDFNNMEDVKAFCKILDENKLTTRDDTPYCNNGVFSWVDSVFRHGGLVTITSDGRIWKTAYVEYYDVFIKYSDLSNPYSVDII